MTFHQSFVPKFSKSFSTFLRVLRHEHPMPSQVPTETSSLFRYTSGRWLWNERAQLESRYRPFDVLCLQQAACRAVGATECISLEKIGEGNYNKAYRLVMEDGQKVIAKIPHPNAGPPMLTTASEVATMEFARTVLDLPAPKVLSWNATDQNPVGAEYIIMEEAKGSQLHNVWKNLQLRAKRDIIRRIVDIERKLLSVSFNKIGSLYFNDSEIPGCEPAATTTGGSREVNNCITSRFCIGPIVRREFWEKERSDMHQYHGPWKSSVDYLESVARREIDWIKAYADPQKAVVNPWQYTSDDQYSPEAHLAALGKFLSAISHIVPKDSEVTSPRLWHPDFHAGNIYIDEQGEISSIIDWQGAWITPVFLGVHPPSLLDYGIDELSMKLPDNFKQLDEVTKDQLRHQVAESILIHSYETLTTETNPLMHKMMHYPHGQTLKQLEAFAGSTWDNCLYPLQDCLMRVEREWDHFQSDEPCPYKFSEEEIRKHHDEVEPFNKNQKLWEELRGIVTDEGYTSNETLDEAIEVFRNLREIGLAGLKGEENIEFDKNTRWVLDLRA
ncbi:kinase-like protein [Xylona heveae TC161]|uniref:Kinase-like protein n=1 Tax=Xylona heveae (strain CBS 132557 / TC161) TaxID=1328760 RepID=A0A161TH12_XYLHT|nr:kinase-like protein [Xylona heveae TC161]KZF25507.1 kinase-like protein [Xylona heveae TC161]